MKYQFILHGENVVRVTSNQPSITCFKPRNVKIALEPSLIVTCRACFFNLYVVVNVSHRYCTNL